MSVLDQYFSLLTEGPNDAKFRKRAQDVFQKLLQVLPSKKNDWYAGAERGTRIDAKLHLGEVLGDQELGDLNLTLSLERGHMSHYGGFRQKPEPTIEFFVEPEDIGLKQWQARELKPDSWKKLVQDRGAEILKGVQTTFIHEFIHYMDWKRMGDRADAVFTKTADSQRSGDKDEFERNIDYHNSPLEFNAFFQEGVANIENYIRNLPGDQRLKAAEKLLGKSPNEFYQRVVQAAEERAGSHFKPGFVTNLLTKNQAKFKKRIAQAWTDIMGDEKAAQAARGGQSADKASAVDRLKAANARAQQKKGKG